jgi:hypothetical protein
MKWHFSRQGRVCILEVYTLVGLLPEGKQTTKKARALSAPAFQVGCGYFLAATLSTCFFIADNIFSISPTFCAK